MKTVFNLTLLVLTATLVGLSADLPAAELPDIQSALMSAQRDLRISVAVEKRIAAELAALKQSGDTPPDVIRDYERYLQRVRDMVTENRSLVAKLQALQARSGPDKPPETPGAKADATTVADPPIPEEQTVDKLGELDRQLDRSLAEFDEMLLKELALIRTASAEKMRDLAQEASDAAERLRKKGIDITSSYDEAPVESEQQSDERDKAAEAEKKADQSTGQTDGKPADQAEDDGEAAVRDKPTDQAGQAAEQSKDHPKNRYDPKDDDIVARQLREAAEKESDPELRKRLWKEYEQYKSGSDRTSSRER